MDTETSWDKIGGHPAAIRQGRIQALTEFAKQTGLIGNEFETILVQEAIKLYGVSKFTAKDYANTVKIVLDA